MVDSMAAEKAEVMAAPMVDLKDGWKAGKKAGVKVGEMVGVTDDEKAGPTVVATAGVSDVLMGISMVVRMVEKKETLSVGMKGDETVDMGCEDGCADG